MSENTADVVQGTLGWEPGDVSTARVDELTPHPKNEDIYGVGEPDEDIAESVRENGVLEPLVIKSDKTIISGHRRWRAAREAGIGRVPVRVAEFESELDEREALIEFNRQREKTFSQKMAEADEIREIVSARKERERRENVSETLSNSNGDGTSENPHTSQNSNRSADERGSGTPSNSKTNGTMENFPSSQNSNTSRDEIAERVGIGSGRTYDKARAVWDAAQDGDERAAEQVEKIDHGEQSISGAVSELDDHDNGSDGSEDTDGDSDNDIDQFTSQQTDEWSSPRRVVEPIADVLGGFDVDPCSGAEQSPFADECYTEDDDGLEQPWHGDVWVNPPYSAVSDWVEKAIGESADVHGGAERVVFLCKGDSSTQWWQSAIDHATLVCAVEGRLSFGDGTNAAPFPSHIFVFGIVTDPLAEALASLGTVLTVGREGTGR